MTILCLDLGTAHTGLAVSEEGILATPIGTIFEKDASKLVGRLTPYIARYDPDKIVIGIPEHGPLVDTAKELGYKLKSIYLGEIVYFPEDLSSRSARSIMKESGKTLAKKKKEEHQTAAAIILQNYLEDNI